MLYIAPVAIPGTKTERDREREIGDTELKVFKFGRKRSEKRKVKQKVKNRSGLVRVARLPQE